MAGKKAGTVKHYVSPEEIPNGMILEDVKITVGARKPKDKLTIRTLLPQPNAAGVIGGIKWLSEILDGTDQGPVFVAQAVRRAIVTSQGAQAGSKNGLKIAVSEIGTIVPKLHTQDTVDKTSAARMWLMTETGLALAGKRKMPTADEIQEKFKGLTL